MAKLETDTGMATPRGPFCLNYKGVEVQLQGRRGRIIRRYPLAQEALAKADLARMQNRLVEESRVFLDVHQDGLTGRHQLSIGRSWDGYRIAGPKFAGASAPIIHHELTERDVRELEQYLAIAKRAFAARAKLAEAA